MEAEDEGDPEFKRKKRRLRGVLKKTLKAILGFAHPFEVHSTLEGSGIPRGMPDEKPAPLVIPPP